MGLALGADDDCVAMCAALLFRVIVWTDADVVVLHAGDKPYLVSPKGQIELSERPLALAALDGLAQELLSPSALDQLRQTGAVDHPAPRKSDLSDHHFTVVAGRWDEDFWIEVRRHRIPAQDDVPSEFFSRRPRIQAGDLSVSFSDKLWAS